MGALNCTFDSFDAGYQVTGQIAARFDPASACDRAGMFGSIIVNNEGPATKTFLLELRLHLASGTLAGSEALASVAGGLTCDGNGGQVAAVAGGPIFRAEADDAQILAAFAGASIVQSGAGSKAVGSASTDGASGPLPEVDDVLVLRHQFTLSGGDRVSFSSVLVVRAATSGGFDGDGDVDGADLGIILANWGQCGLGDLNEDQVIDGADLGGLLATWTG